MEKFEILFTLVLVSTVTFAFVAYRLEAIAKLQKLNEDKTVGFHARLSQDFIVQNSRTVIFDHAISNIGNSYNGRTGIFTAPYDGLYFFTSSFLSKNDRLHLRMMKNDEEISRAYGSNPGSQTGSMEAVVALREGDVVKVQHIPLVARQTVHEDYSYFSGYLIKITE